MADELPKWPESLPPPTKMVEGPRQRHLTQAELGRADAINDLFHDIYWFPDDQYFLYFLYGEGVGEGLSSTLQAQGIEVKKTEMYFYKHPKPAYANDFIRVLPNEDVPHAAQGPMYGRITLSLEPARRKEMDFQENARVTSSLIADSEPALELKPNFAGIGFNLNSLWRKAGKWLRRRIGLTSGWSRPRGR